ncbi:MAG: NAD(P)H-hydrate dehydratase [Paracoccaceae bacterium]
MSELLTSAQMRAIEAAAIDSGAVTGLELMERAGRGVVEAIMAHWPHLAKSSYRAVVLCGPGNNGGDGFVIARLLRQSGWEVTVFLHGDAAKLPPDARANFDRWSAMGDVLPLSERAFRKGGRNIADLYIDAIFGTGLSRAPDGELAQVLRHLGGSGGDDYAAQMVSVDAPSGLCLDSGRVLVANPNGARPFEARFAALTVTFQSAKAGHYLADGPAACGELVVKDIGLGPATAAPHPSVRLAAAPHPAILSKTPDTHKYTHGHALVLCGPSGKTGAARLAARGALRIGAGLVTLGVPEAAIPEVAAQVTSVMTLPIDSPEDLRAALTDTRINALCLGPGLGGERAAALLPVALEARRRMVLDADALTALSQNPDLMGLLHEGCILTPHAGEFARLFPQIAARLQAAPLKGPAYSKVDATREAAAAAGCTVLYKGRDTVIAQASGRAILSSAQYDRAAPWLATAGSGDVLAGFITGLLARGGAVSGCAEMAATLHVDCARSFGAGLIAEDLPEQLPQVMSALGLT